MRLLILIAILFISTMAHAEVVIFEWLPCEGAYEYLLYESRVSGEYGDPVCKFPAETLTTKKDLKPGTYFWIMRVADEYGAPSAPSIELTYTVPLPPVQGFKVYKEE